MKIVSNVFIEERTWKREYILLHDISCIVLLLIILKTIILFHFTCIYFYFDKLI
jgi:hypothetical protein